MPGEEAKPIVAFLMVHENLQQSPTGVLNGVHLSSYLCILQMWNMHGHCLSLCKAKAIRGLNEWARLPSKREDLRTKTMLLGESSVMASLILDGRSIRAR
eukprot:scaffold37744_cov151-Skeletonema_marinoi.AAC.5